MCTKKSAIRDNNCTFFSACSIMRTTKKERPQGLSLLRFRNQYSKNTIAT